MPEREFYFKTDSNINVPIRNAYIKNITQNFSFAWVKILPKQIHQQKIFLALETQLAKASKKLEDLRDPYANYHKYATKDLVQSFSAN